VKWHAIYSTPAGEFRAMLGIDAAHIEAFCPVERLRAPGRSHKRDVQVVIRPLFPRYLFARLDGGRDLGRVLEIDGVADVLRINGRPGYVDERLVDALRRAQELGVFDRTNNRLALEEGAEVEIKDPRYEGLIAKVKASRSKDRIRVILDNGMIMSVPANKVAKAG
jgi:transcriptional antiterminator RfaH